MKKSLIALAVAGAFAPSAFAATSNVDVYGQATLSYDYINTNSNAVGADKKLSRISSNASRIGFKGSEDLGGGLAAIWQIEQQFDWDNGTQNLVGTLGNNTNLNLRNTFVGLKSNSLGTALLGKHDTPYKLATAKMDIFADTLGDYNNIVGNVNGSNNFDLRPGNVAAYITPTFSGLHGAIAYVAGNELGNGTAANQSAWSAMGMYDNGPIFASLAYEKHNNVGALNFSNDRKALKAGVGYKFGDAQLGLIYEDADTIVGTTAANEDNKSRKAWYLNGQYTLGSVVLKAAYGRAGDIKSVNNSSARTYDLGADYLLSKRTKMYAVYQKVNNDSAGLYGLGAGQGSSYTPIAGRDPSAFSVGVRHTF